MGALIHSVDWSATPVGALENWSPALQITVRILLANRFPQLLWWGPDYVSIYNDAYRPILARKHPWALGKPVSECWSEIWHVLKPLIDVPFHGGQATWSEDIELQINRAGFIEETHFTISYSPVPDDTVTGGIGGVLATVHEITEKVIGQRRVNILRDLAARTAESKTAQDACAVSMTTLRPHTKDIPFALLYLTESSGKWVRLAASCGVDKRGDISPRVVQLDENEKGRSEWPLGTANRTGRIQIVKDLSSRFASVPPGPWPDPPECAVILPIRSHVARQYAGFLIAGTSSRLQCDEEYQNFLRLVATQITSAIASAQAYEEERKRVEALAEIDRAKTAFFSNVSHEFRTPITLMLGPLEEVLANRHGILSMGAAANLSISHRNALRLLKLVNTLLDFSRIEEGRAQASYQRVDLPALTAEIASNFQSLCERAGVRLIVDCAPFPPDPPAWVDRDMWEKIVLNLLSNAFKFTLKGEIEVHLEASEGQARLTVRDTGVGIPFEELPLIFERFHRVEQNRGRTHEGTGIGLALVKELVNLHGGSIAVESVLDEGSTFRVAIPLGEASKEERAGGASAVRSTGVTPSAYVDEALRWLPDELSNDEGWEQSGTLLPTVEPMGNPVAKSAKPRILWADDNADMRAYIRRLLCERFTVQAVADGEAALDAARADPPDLILSDVMMPKLDGFGLLRAVRADPRLREIPMILLSARAGEENLIEGIESGADDYLTKPFGARELVARIESHVKISRMRQETKRVAIETAQQRRLLEQVYAAQEEERQRIARELHDEAGQLLAALLVEIKALEGSRSLSAVKAVSPRVSELARQALDDLRRIARGLHPKTLADHGLHVAVSEYVAEYAKRHGIRVKLIEEGLDTSRLPARIQIAAYRIVQEALTNIARHAQSKSANVTLRRSSDLLEISVMDRGRGFDTTALQEVSESHLGLRSIRERSSLLGGSATVNSGPSGTEVLVRIPIG